MTVAFNSCCNDGRPPPALLTSRVRAGQIDIAGEKLQASSSAVEVVRDNRRLIGRLGNGRQPAHAPRRSANRFRQPAILPRRGSTRAAAPSPPRVARGGDAAAHARAIRRFGDEQDFDFARFRGIGLDLPTRVDIPTDDDPPGRLVRQHSCPVTLVPSIPRSQWKLWCTVMRATPAWATKPRPRAEGYRGTLTIVRR